MKKHIITLTFLIGSLFAAAQEKSTKKIDTPDPNKKIDTVEASCGQCKLGLKGKGCALAVRIDGKSYFVDGTDIDSHGDAHEKDGFCETIRKAAVQGEIVGDRFRVSYFSLIAVKN